MTTILIGLILGILLGIGFYLLDRKYGWGIENSTSSISILSGIIVGGFLGIIVALWMPIKTETKLTETYQLKSLQDNISSNGTFFLGCGNINGAIYYSYYIEKDGYFQPHLMRAANTVKIKIDSIDTPRIEVYDRVVIKNSKNRFSLRPLFPSSEDVIIYVPRGSIEWKYNLDAK